MTTVFRQKDMQLQQLLREIRYVDICVAYQSGSFITTIHEDNEGNEYS